MYADVMTESMNKAIFETQRRRQLQQRIVLGVVLILVAVTLIIAGRSLHIPFPHLRFRRAR